MQVRELAERWRRQRHTIAALDAECRRLEEQLATVERERDLSRLHVQDLVRTLRDSRRLPIIADLATRPTQEFSGA